MAQCIYLVTKKDGGFFFGSWNYQAPQQYMECSGAHPSGVTNTHQSFQIHANKGKERETGRFIYFQFTELKEDESNFRIEQN